MAIDAQCPGCGAKVRAPDHLAGKPVKCRSCGRAFPVVGDVRVRIDDEDDPGRILPDWHQASSAPTATQPPMPKPPTAPVPAPAPGSRAHPSDYAELPFSWDWLPHFAAWACFLLCGVSIVAPWLIGTVEASSYTPLEFETTARREAMIAAATTAAVSGVAHLLTPAGWFIAGVLCRILISVRRLTGATPSD